MRSRSTIAQWQRVCLLRDPDVEMITSIREQIDKVKLALHHMQNDVNFWSQQRSKENEEIETE